MAPTPTRSSSRVRPSPASKSPRRRDRSTLRDSDDEARYVVTVRSAKNLKREGFRGLTNAYCQLSVGRQGPFSTDVVFDSINPSWAHKRQTFEFREGTGTQEDKLSLACFNSGDVPELIGRLNVALSHANHKVISLPMFRRDIGGTQVWAGSVEIELHYVPEGQSRTPPSHLPAGSVSSQDGGGYPPVSSSPCSASLASSFAKAALLFPDKSTTPGGTVQTDLLALSPRVARGAVDIARLGRNGYSKNGRYGGGGGKKKKLEENEGEEKEACLKERGRGGAGAGNGWSWKAFFSGILFSVVLILGALWALGDPLLLGGAGLGVGVVEEGVGRQTFIVISGSKISRLADRHLVVFVGEQELCRGGVPAPAPPTEGSVWAYDLWTPDETAAHAAAAAAAAAADGGGNSKGKRGRGGGEAVAAAGSEHDAEEASGTWQEVSGLVRRLAAPLYAARKPRPT